jgi:hypothetical protein
MRRARTTGPAARALTQQALVTPAPMPQQASRAPRRVAIS